MSERKATMRNTDTGEVRIVQRGTEEYDELVQSGWLSAEQISHRKEYKEQWQPTYDDEYEDDYDYTDFDEQEALKQMVDDMYDDVVQEIDRIPNEKMVKGRRMIDLSESKQMLFNVIDDLYADIDNDDTVNTYYKEQFNVITELVNAVRYDSTQEEVETHISQLASVLNGGALSLDMAKALGAIGEFNGRPEYSAKFANMGRKDEW